MDPNATLEIIRVLIGQVKTTEIRSGNYIVLAELALDLAEHINALDTWMTRGGHLPEQWVRAKR